MAVYIVGGGDEVPADGQIDLAAVRSASCNHPVWLSFAFWVVTADLLAGAFTIDINYVDPTGGSRVINGQPVSLADGSAFSTTPVNMIVPQSLSSAFTLDKNLIGAAGDAMIGYRVMMTDNIDEITSVPF